VIGFVFLYSLEFQWFRLIGIEQIQIIIGLFSRTQFLRLQRLEALVHLGLVILTIFILIKRLRVWLQNPFLTSHNLLLRLVEQVNFVATFLRFPQIDIRTAKKVKLIDIIGFEAGVSNFLKLVANWLLIYFSRCHRKLYLIRCVATKILASLNFGPLDLLLQLLKLLGELANGRHRLHLLKSLL